MANGDRRPNVVFIMADDHTAHAVGAYGSRINRTPNIDRIAAEGARLDACFCTNSLCAPSRATILTGTYSHINGVRTLNESMDARQPTFPGMLRQAGYRAAIFGKWHLGHGGIHDPTGFDTWEILNNQGTYFNPELLTGSGRRVHEGYVTDIITEHAIDWMRHQPTSSPFCVLITHKAPHVPREWDDAHADLHAEEIPVPESFFDDYANRSAAAREALMRISRMPLDRFKQAPSDGLTGDELTLWKYQQIARDYLRCVASLDDNTGRVLAALDELGIADDTVVVYTSDQGYFLGDHGWTDKRFMYEESLRMPLLIRYPREIRPGTTIDDIVTNVDFAQTFLDYGGVEKHPRMQGRSFRPLLRGELVANWPTSVYYRYWMHDDPTNHVRAHYGIRTKSHKLICYYSDGLGLPGTSARRFPVEWELFDLEEDPLEMRNVCDLPDYAEVRSALQQQLATIQEQVGDLPAAL
jgi:arylsulfatase A-like enzyme